MNREYFNDQEQVKQEKYTKLVGAIEFFSQRFSLENMTKYIYEFSMQLLEPEECFLFILKDNQYQSYNKGDTELFFDKTKKHDEMVYFHAGLLYEEHLPAYIPEEIAYAIDVNCGIPVVVDKKLFGLLLIKKTNMQRDDVIIAEALMNLYHLALTNLNNYKNLERAKKELDSKVFNLFAINQASKALLSELDTDYLVDLSLSVFAELTQSKISSIFLYDAISDSYNCLGSLDVYNKLVHRPISLARKKGQAISDVVVDWQDDKGKNQFLKQFEFGMKGIEFYQPSYIINLVNDGDLLGFVTVSDKVNGQAFDASVFELVESLASSTYVAIYNSRLLKEVKAHRKLAETKFQRLKRLNALIKNLNTASDYRGLLELTLEMLRINFGYKTSFYASFDEDEFLIEKAEGFMVEAKVFKMNQDMMNLKDGKAIISFDVDDVASSLAMIMTDDLYDQIQGMIMVPVIIEDIQPTLLGTLCLLDVKEGALSTEENLITLETISNQIAPIIRQLQFVQKVQAEYVINYKAKLGEHLTEAFVEADETDTEVFIIAVKSNVKSLFDRRFKEEAIKLFAYSYPLRDDFVVIISHSLNNAQEVLLHYESYEFKFIEYPAHVKDLDQLNEELNSFYYS